MTYLCSRNHDTNIFNSLCELIGLDSAVIVKIEVFEGLKKNGLFILLYIQARQFLPVTITITINNVCMGDRCSTFVLADG